MPSARTKALTLRLALVVLTFIVGTAAYAAEALDVRQHSDLGAYLVDGEGMSLYLFLPDEMGPSTCYDDCAASWPPVRLPEGGMDAPVVNGDVRPGLIGAVERDDGSRQLTYGGWPLYTFARDAEPGDVAGQGVGGNWYLVRPDSTPLEVDAETAEPGADTGATDGDGDIASAMENGELVYTSIAEPTCASCHGSEGEGDVGPALAGSRVVANPGRLIRTILFGGQMMPRIGDQLSDEQVADLATFVANSWGNDHGVITVEEVMEQR